MLRSLGFVLRAIGDKRAVPALIRAIPTTLRKPGSDMRCRADEGELFTCMQKMSGTSWMCWRDCCDVTARRGAFASLTAVIRITAKRPTANLAGPGVWASV